jgi:DNA polymerase III subunit delta'
VVGGRLYDGQVSTPPTVDLDAHAHARAVLGAALSRRERPSHAYLFHGPAGSGKRTAARAFAAVLLSERARSPATVAERVARGAHPDLTWVAPSGAAEMLVGDIDEPVVAAASRTPFESARRVFVIEGADAMNDQAANRMLKTLEEPAPFVHLILLADSVQDVLATIASRCQHVRFDPLPAELIERGLLEEGVEQTRARACSRLALGDAGLARALSEQAGSALRASAERYIRGALGEETGGCGWTGLLDVANEAGERAGVQLEAARSAELELVGSKERKRAERETSEARRRVERRARTRTLDLGLRLAELWVRDLLCLAEGVGELVHAADRIGELELDVAGRTGERLREAIELVADTRMRLALNVSEELALEALAYRLRAVLSPA